MVKPKGDAVDKRLSAQWYLDNSNEPPPEQIASVIKLLNDEIAAIPESNRAAMKQSEEKGYVMSDTEKATFLQSEDWNPAAAAKRIVRNWDERLRLFGPEKAYLPLTLEGALRDDIEVLETGFVQVTDALDDALRGILFLSPHKYLRGTFSVDAQVSSIYPGWRCSIVPPLSVVPANNAIMRSCLTLLHTKIRAIWYMVHVLLESAAVQKNGFILMLNASTVSPKNMHRALQKKAAYSVGHCLPMRIGAFHVCQPTLHFRFALPVIKFFIGSPLKQRIKVSKGTEEEIISKLNEYGIPADQVPSDISGGKYELDHAKWLEARQ